MASPEEMPPQVVSCLHFKSASELTDQSKVALRNFLDYAYRKTPNWRVPEMLLLKLNASDSSYVTTTALEKQSAILTAVVGAEGVKLKNVQIYLDSDRREENAGVWHRLLRRYEQCDAAVEVTLSGVEDKTIICGQRFGYCQVICTQVGCGFESEQPKKTVEPTR